MFQSKKTLWLLVGPNGAGKTTLREKSSYGHLWGDIDWILPDKIALSVKEEGVENFNMEAAKRAIREARRKTKEGESFATEATLSANYHIRLAHRLKEDGWKIGVVYVGLESPELSKTRVDDRVALGGHDVPKLAASRSGTIRRRYFSSVCRLPELVAIADEVYLIDNSKKNGFGLMASGKDGILVTLEEEETRLQDVIQALRYNRVVAPCSWGESFLENDSVNNDKKHIWLIAGPNGAGKTTFMGSGWCGGLAELPFLNSDNVARELRPDATEEVFFQAGKKVLKDARSFSKAGQSFVIETTLSGGIHLKMMRELKDQGWHVGMVYVSVATEELSRERIAERVSKGGHHVTDRDVARRWPRSAANLLKAIEIADQIHVLDNTEVESYVHVAHGGRGVLKDLRNDRPVLTSLMDSVQKAGFLSSGIDRSI